MRDLAANISLASVLRTTGAMTVVAALCAHLLNDWQGFQGWNDLSRYYVLLGSAAFLAFAGLAMSYIGRDNKSARVFLGLGLLAVAANVTTLGGLLHEVVQWDGARPVHPGLFDWSLASGAGLALAIGAAAAILLPLSWFAFKVLLRPNANELTAVFAATNLLVLVPVRESLGVGLLIAAALALPVVYLRPRVGAQRFRTAEGRFAAATLFVPAIVMLGRLLWLYQADELLLWVLCVIAFAATRFTARAIPEGSPWQFVNGMASVGFALCVAWLSAFLLAPYVLDELAASAFVLVLAGLIYGMGYQHPGSRSTFAVAGAATLAIGTAWIALLFGTIAASIIGSLLGLLTIALGRLEQARDVQRIGVVGVVLAVLPQLVEFVQWVDFTHWITLALIGTAGIILGSIVERRSRSSAA